MLKFAIMMKKNIFFLLLTGLFVLPVWSQSGDLEIKSDAKSGIYLAHKVTAKQTYYGIGKLYNVTPEALASFNGLTTTKSLQINQVLKVPLTAANFSQTTNSGTPVYYTVKNENSLLQITEKAAGVPVTQLQKWNNKPDYTVKAGEKIIVGLLKTAEMRSVTLKTTVEPSPVGVEDKTQPIEEEVVKQIEPVKEELTRYEEVVEEEPPVIEKNEIDALEGVGFFKPHYVQQIKLSPAKNDRVVTSGIFKTISGWADSKYYLLIDNIYPGTIVKLYNPSSGKVIYAKVLGYMSGIKQNDGYDIRISSAAAAALDVADNGKFVVNISY